jgi:hypothetical protein
MNWWVYKNNSTKHTTGRLQGDWHPFFDANRIDEWGYEADVPALGKVAVGDHILCYQSNRNTLVGLAVAERWRDTRGGRELWLRPVRRIEVRIRPLKKRYPSVARINAFRSGPIQTVNAITRTEVEALFRACGYKDIPIARAVVSNGPVTIEQDFIEGSERASRSRCRNPRLAAAAKKRYGTTCHCCHFDFAAYYGKDAEGLCVVHHLDEFRGTRGKRSTTIKDVRVVCANCHLVLHKEQPAMKVETLRSIVRRLHGPSRARRP